VGQVATKGESSGAEVLAVRHGGDTRDCFHGGEMGLRKGKKRTHRGAARGDSHTRSRSPRQGGAR
jgi:hypothetical protein